MSSEGAAFGLAVSSEFDVLGLEPGAGAGDRKVVLRRATRAEIEARWPRRQGRRLGGLGTGRGSAHLLDHGDGGLVWRAPGYGLYRLTRDGRRLDCAPPARARPWFWQRMLIGQALPLAALVQGLEVLHAGAVATEAGAVAIAADSGVGKSTLVAALLAQGADFLADDVVALEAARPGVLVHPGTALMSLRAGTPGIGEEVGADEHERRVRVPRVDGPRPLRALVLLRRGVPARLEALDPADPRPLLAATFNRSVLHAERLARQFDVCARVAATARLFALGVDRTRPPAENATRLLEALA